MANVKKIIRKKSLYERFIKRLMDFSLALIAIIVLSPVFLIVAILVRTKLGSPIIFKQKRPGFNEKIFTMYKFRTMTNEKDEKGNFLPDCIRLTKFGKFLRSTSLDELPELINIIKGDLSIVGPRPLLVFDMLFMTQGQRMRHNVKPGLTGLAQINGRNELDWEEKLKYDLKYIYKITFFLDLKIIIITFLKVFFKHEGITHGEMATAEDFGDYLLNKQKISLQEYEQKRNETLRILSKN